MRVVALTGFILAVGLAAAAPGPAPPEPSAPRKGDGPADRYLPILFNVLEQIVKDYVRPVEREDLLYAALAGLYEEARLPVPTKLKQEVRQAAKALGDRADAVDEGVPTEPAVDDVKKLIRGVVAE